MNNLTKKLILSQYDIKCSFSFLVLLEWVPAQFLMRRRTAICRRNIRGFLKTIEKHMNTKKDNYSSICIVIKLVLNMLFGSTIE